ncbi:MAG TPA: NAD(P)H-binding protein, partial [Longimicrobiales bacterium]|nr:NAD(P)H-binding protein [Longimicrobiales bacterium]
MSPNASSLRPRPAFARGLAVAAAVLALACSPERDGAEAPQATPKIIVSGASGQLGGLAVEALLERGVAPSDLILVSRTPETLERYAALGASTRFGDFTQPESLVSAYEGGTKLLLISLNTRGNPNPRVASERQALQRTAIEAAVAAGVEHIVYTSFVDADDNVSPIAVDHRVTEADLRESGVSWTALRNQWYADRIVGEAANMIAEGRALVHADDPGTAYVTREDCAAAAAAALTNPGHENRVYEITGPDRVRGIDIAALAGEIAGVEIEVVEVGPDEAEQLPELPPSGATLSTHFRDLTGLP